VTFQTIKRPSFTRAEHARRFPIDELDTVTLVADERTDDDELVPAGTVGTVVAVWGEAEAFDIEFDAPFTGIATLMAGQIKTRGQR